MEATDTEGTAGDAGRAVMPGTDATIVVLGRDDPFIHVLPRAQLWQHRAWDPQRHRLFSEKGAELGFGASDRQGGVGGVDAGHLVSAEPPPVDAAGGEGLRLIRSHLAHARARAEGLPDAAHVLPLLDRALAPGLSFSEVVQRVSDTAGPVVVPHQDGPDIAPTDTGSWFHNLWHRVWD